MKNSTLKAGIGYIIGNYLLKGIAFFSVPIFARLMSKADFGIYNTFTAYEGILFVLIGFAIHSSYKNAYFTNTDNSVVKNYSAYASSTISLIIGNALFLITLSFIFKNVLVHVLNMKQWMIVILIIYAMSSAIISCYNADCSLRLEYKKFLIASGFNAVYNIAVSAILILSFPERGSYIGRIIGTVSGAVIVAIYAVVVFFKRSKPNYEKAEMIWGLKYGLPIVPHGISQVILSSFDRIMINNMIGNVEAGIYSFAYTIYTIIQVTSTSIDTVWSPWFYKKRGNDDFASIRKYSSQIIILMLLLCTAFVMISPEFIIIFGGSKYKESVYCVMPLVGGAFFAFLYYFPAVVEYYHEKTGYVAIGTISAALINIVLNYVCIEKYGYIAAAYTTLATYFLYFVFHLILSIRIEGKSLYSVTIIILSSASMIGTVLLGGFLVGFMTIRIIIFIVLILIAVIYEEMHFLILKNFTRKFKIRN